ncbi:hypothetical protein D5F01_LYC02658 [Larimichthys crocea]|uniref:Bcl-2-like protein 15 n=1 Tax=Larimichthys crocea TaxID=215358 RepID=A0A6G0J347_LARCR|nr:hypothetical protein D5F01_LYC02658 [Larimichthys crocea]
MAPTEIEVEWQTCEIIKYLFEDEEDVTYRTLSLDAGLETDGPAGSNDNFDPVIIADKLRTVADALNEDLKFKAALESFKKAAQKEVTEQAFSQGVEALCQTQVFQTAEVAPELQLIRASAAFGRYVIKSSPELKNQVIGVMTAFVNNRVSPWLTKQGGWDKVKI